jgi:tRNA-guanine family transglycosylase
MRVLDFYPVLAGPGVDVRNMPLGYRWWRKECPIYHPYVLVSYGQILPSTIFLKDRQYLANYTKYMELTDDVKLILDSGGFQIVSRKMDIDPREVLEWQLANARPGDIIVPLDYPPPPDASSLEQIEPLAQKTARSTELWLKAVDRHGGDLKVLVPIQGRWREAIDLWVKYTRDYVQTTGMVAFGGLAFSPPLPRETYINIFLMRVKPVLDLGVKYIHVFGASTPFLLAYFMFFSNHAGIDMSTDTSKPSKLTAFGRIVFPGQPTKYILRFFRRSDLEVTALRCHCSPCQILWGGYVTRATRAVRDKHWQVTLHNLFQDLLVYDKATWYLLTGKIEEYLSKKFRYGSEAINLTKMHLAGQVDLSVGKSPPAKGGLSRWL